MGVSRRTRGDGGIASRVAEAMLRWDSPQEILGFVTSLWPSEPDAPLVEAQRIPKVGETEERAARVRAPRNVPSLDSVVCQSTAIRRR